MNSELIRIIIISAFLISITEVFLTFREIERGLVGVQALYARWCDLQHQPYSAAVESSETKRGNSFAQHPEVGTHYNSVTYKAELDATTEELRTSVRGLEWDIDDLAHTIDMFLTLSYFVQVSDPAFF